MKFILRIGVSCFVGMAIIYVIASFASGSFDLGQWSHGVRGMAAFTSLFWCLMSAFSFFMEHTIKDY